jgi:hypothetical protein
MPLVTNFSSASLTYSLNAPAVGASLPLAIDSSALNIVADAPLSYRNRIINGDMRIDQRNSGASVGSASGSTAYIVDRWFFAYTQTNKMTGQQNAGSVTPPAGYTNYVGITSSSAYSVLAGDTFGLFHRVEGLNVADLGWGTASAQAITLSFWVRSSLTGTFGGALNNSAGDRSYPFSFTISAANTWEQKTITIAGDTTGTWLSNNGIGIQLIFGLGSGATFSGTAGAWAAGNLRTATGATSVVGTNGATFYLTGVQLEVGSKASAFERRPYGMELQLCQRYYEKSFNQSVAPANNTGDNRFGNVTSFAGVNISTVVPFKVAKRISGNATVYNPLNTTANTFSVFVNGSWVNTSAGNPAFNEFGINLEAQATGAATGSSYLISCHWAANAEL